MIQESEYAIEQRGIRDNIIIINIKKGVNQVSINYIKNFLNSSRMILVRMLKVSWKIASRELNDRFTITW